MLPHIHKRTTTIGLAMFTAVLYACSGGGGGTPSTPSTTINGIATDGYLNNAQVCMDSNDNGVCDIGEPTTTTASDGSYQLPVPNTDLGKHQLLLIATAGNAADADVPDSKVIKNFILATPKEHPEIISPLTSAVVAEKNANGTSTSDAAQAVLQALTISDNNINSTHLFTDYSSNTSQQTNSSLIKLANFAKAINVNIANQSSLADSLSTSVISAAASTSAISQNIINSSLINSINRSTPISTQNLQANIMSTDYVSAMKKIDGFWFGTYYHMPTQKTYQICQSQGDSIITADGWITIFGQASTSCPHSSGVVLEVFIRANFSINPTTNKVTINKGFVLTMDSTGNNVDSVTELSKGSGELTNVTSPNTAATNLKITLNDGSIFDANWDPTTTAPKTAVVQDFSLTAGRYIGRSNSDVVGSDFAISNTGALTGTLKEVFGAPINKTYTCAIVPSTGYLVPKFTGYYMINNMRGECAESGSNDIIKKTWNGFAVPIHASNQSYGTQESIVGAQNAASIFINLFDAGNQQIFFASDNLVLQ
jgi:hypothetical protein